MYHSYRKEVSPVITNINANMVRRVHRLRRREERDRTGLYYIEGMRFVDQAITHGVRIETLVVSRPLLSHPYAQRLLKRQERLGTSIVDVSPEILQRISLVDDPQGIGAIVHQRWERLSDLQVGDELCWLAHDFVRSPGNLGTMLRTAEAVGAAGMILLDRETDPYEPAAVRATMGALFAQRFVRATRDEFIQWKRRVHAFLVGTSPTASRDYSEVVYRRPTVLLMGEERKGLPQELQALCDEMVCIPMVGKSDSLNLAIATSILLYEVFNQRRKTMLAGKEEA
jgi:RNA methyltransferase, TrmH family